VLKRLLYLFSAPFVLLVLYLLATLIAGLIPVNVGGSESPTGVPVAVQSNGVHTDLVLPINTLDIDWRRRLPIEVLKATPGELDFLAFGWGDREFYLSTPTWADLRASTAFKALTGLDSSVLHVEAVPRTDGDPQARHLRLSPDQYHRLVKLIEASFRRGPAGNVLLIPGASYGDHDAFFEARGHYSLFVTCNEWARRALAGAGVRAPLWAPFDIALFYQLPADKAH
jgi:uncharacterized protein (TIGR02117 family)